MKRIMFIESASSFGGSTISLYTLIKHLDKSRFCPIVVSCKENSEDYFLRAPLPNNTEYTRVSMPQPWTHNNVYNFTRKYSHKLATVGRYVYWTKIVQPQDIVKFYTLGRRYRVDAFHINNGYGYSLAIAIAAKMLGVPCIGHFRDLTFPYGAPIKQSKRLVKHCIAVSQDIKNQMMGAFDLDEQDVDVIWNGVDSDDYDVSSETDYIRKEFNITNEKTIGLLGRIIEWKGIKEFIYSIKTVVEQTSNIKAFIVGYGNDEKYLAEVKELVRALDLTDKVIFTGYRQDNVNLINFLDVVVNSSIRPEPLGRTLNEAMALGTPVVAHAAGGSLEQVIDGQTGFLVPVGDTTCMGEAIAKIITDSELYKKMCFEARKRFNLNFRGDAHARKVEAFYNSRVFID